MYFPLKTAKLEKAIKGLYGHIVDGDNITIIEKKKESLLVQ